VTVPFLKDRDHPYLLIFQDIVALGPSKLF